MLIRLTGLITIEDDGHAPRHLSSAQAQVAFARLALERAGGTSRDQLADTVWPNGLPDTWASALRSVVSRVRAFVASAQGSETTPLIAQGGRYLLGLPSNATIDIEYAEETIGKAIEALVADAFADAQRLATDSISFLSRPFLPDHEGEWANGVRERVHELLMSGLETASLAASALRDERNALRFADEAVKRAPLRESAYRCLMTAHVAAGNRAEALRSYHRLRRTLAEELGIDPAPETQAAYVDLLGTPMTSSRGRGTPHRDPGSAARYTGRRTELATLAEAWTQAENGAGHIVLVTGEAGIGKTRLVTEAAQRVGIAGGAVMFGRCDHGSPMPYQPFVQALVDFITATPDESMPELSAASRKTLAALVAEPEHRLGEVAAAKRAELHYTLSDLLVRVARDRPVFMVIDDIDLADEDTLALLRHVFRRYGSGLPLLVVATAGANMNRFDRFMAAVQDIDQEGFVHRVAVRGLEESDIRALIRQVLPEAAAGDVPPPHRLMDETAGNAYLLLELLRWHRNKTGGNGYAPPGLPSGVLDYASSRLAALNAPSRQLLCAAAVADGSFELDLTAEAAGLGLEQAMDALDVLVAKGIVTEVVTAAQGRRYIHEYRFTHGLLRQATYEKLSKTRRHWLHARLADAIEHLRAGNLGSYSQSLAYHRAAGATPHGDQRAVRSSWRAATRAGLDGAQNEAVRLYRQALHHVPASDQQLWAEALTRLGLAQLAAGHPECGQNLLDGTIQALHISRLDIAAQAALGLADATEHRPRFRPEAAALIDRLLSADGTPGGHAVYGARAVIDDLSRGRLLARGHRLGKRIAPGAPTTAALDAMAAELRLLEGPDHVKKRLALAGEMLTVATAAGDTGARIVAAHHGATAADMLGDLPACQNALAALAAAVSEGDDVMLGDALLVDHVVATAVTQGRFTDAVAVNKHFCAPADGGRHGITPVPGSLGLRQMLIARWLRGSAWPRTDDGVRSGGEAVERSLAALLDGDKGPPHLTVRALAIGAEPLPPGDEWLHNVGLLALCAAEFGDPTTAEAMRGLLTPYAHLTCGVGYRSFVGPTSFHLGRLAVVMGEWDEAERHLMSALSHLSSRKARPWMALAQHDLARALDSRARTGDRRCAEALRSEANWTLASLGLQGSLT